MDPTLLLLAFIVIPLFWCIFGIIAAVVASSRGHGGCLWFGSGVLLGPLALPFALLLPEDDATRTARLVSRGAHRLCPYCAEAIQTAAIRCRHCSSDVSGSLPQQAG